VSYHDEREKFFGGAEISGVEFVEAGAPHAEPFSRSNGGDLVPAKGPEDFPDQRSIEATGDLPMMSVTLASIAASNGLTRPTPVPWA